MAEVVDKELLPMTEIIAHLRTPQIEEQIISAITNVARRRLLTRLPFFIPGGLKEILGQIIEDALRRETPAILQRLEKNLAGGTSFSIGCMVAEKINKLDFREVEALILSVAAKELRYIEYLGGLLGFLIGLVQMALAAGTVW